MSNELDYDTDYFNGVYLVRRNDLDNPDLDIGIQELPSLDVEYEAMFRIQIASQYVRKLIDDY